MSTRLYVGNLSRETTLDDLKSLFGQVARVISIEIRPSTGRSQGHGFVEIDAASVRDVIFKLGITELDGRMLKVEMTQPGSQAV